MQWSASKMRRPRAVEPGLTAAIFERRGSTARTVLVEQVEVDRPGDCHLHIGFRFRDDACLGHFSVEINTHIFRQIIPVIIYPAE